MQKTTNEVPSLNKTAWVIAILLCAYQPMIAQAQDKNEELFWHSLDCKEKPQIALYLKIYPEGSYISAARACLEQSEKIHRQLLQCEAHLTANRLLTGQGGNALDCYKSVLQKDPGNARALAGITAIGDKYVAQLPRRLEKKKQENEEQRKKQENEERKNEQEAEKQRKEQEAEKQRKKQENEERKNEQEKEEQRKKQENEERKNEQENEERKNEQEKEERKKEQENEERKNEQEKEEWRRVAGKMIAIPGGRFHMGDLSDDDYADEKPAHPVSISPFQIGLYEVTVGQFRAFVADSGYDAGTDWDSPEFTQDDTHPVVEVSYNDAQAFIRWLNAKTGGNYRLPTEAEWEYAARAGTTSRYSWGDNKRQAEAYAWHTWNSEGCTHAVGSKEPNLWGLYDMHGNVWEWVQDWYGENYYKNSPASDPQGPRSGTSRTVRGGGWGSHTGSLRSARRGGGGWGSHTGSLRSARRGRILPSTRSSKVGFRLVRQP